MTVINTALLSFGMSGKVFHAPFIHLHPGFKLAGSWERSNQVIRDFYPEARSYQSLEEVLADQSIDLIVVNTPTSTHADYATKALLSEKHVIVEKAFTTNAAEAIQLNALAKASGKKLSVYQNRRWDSDFLTVQSILKKKLLGEVREAFISFERFNLELSPKLHKEMPGPGTGNLLDLGPHLVDQALVLFGLPQSVLTADIRSFRPGSRVDDFFDILLSYQTFSVRLRSGYHFPVPEPGFIIRGSKGSFVKSRSDVQETQLKNGQTPLSHGYGIEPESAHGSISLEKGSRKSDEYVKSLPGNYMAYYNAMHHAIVSDSPVPVSGAEGIYVMKVLDAARESHQSKSEVEI